MGTLREQELAERDTFAKEPLERPFHTRLHSQHGEIF